MKAFNWGNGISIAIILFVIATLSVVSYLISLDFYLVNSNHYEEGVEYQSTIDSKERTKALEESVAILFDEERVALKLVFPESIMAKADSGTITLYRPNDSDKDLRLPLEFKGGNTQIIPMERLDKGKWILTLNWTMDSLQYTEEKTVII
jgi:nitrogen fixation protein FixH